LAQETNAKTCASLVLRVEKETIEWFLPETQEHVEHTPSCLFAGSTHSAEMVRSFLRRKKPLSIDRTKSCQPAGIARFQLSSEKKEDAEDLVEAEAAPVTEASPERMHSPV